MRHYRHGAHTKTDLKAHIVWIPKYRKKVLIGPVAVRVRDLIRQIAMEHELHIISGKVARDHVHVFVSYRPHQDLSTIVQWLKGISLPSTPSGVCSPEEEVLGPALLGPRISGGEFRKHNGRDGKGVVYHQYPSAPEIKDLRTVHASGNERIFRLRSRS